jgi:UDP-N-acetylglucosamine 2-epimerase (non-hydrolysing)
VSIARLHILVLIGTRPEAIKMFPVVHALEASERFSPVVITTGQHADLVAPILELAGIVPDFDLEVGHPGLTLNDLVATVITRFDAYCRDHYGATGARVSTQEERWGGFPVAALVHGDTSSALAAAVAAFNLRIPVGHIEAGLRTGGSVLTPFPEELNRQLIARIAAFHLAPTPIAEETLVREGVRDQQVFVTGNTGIDALQYAARQEATFDDPAVSDALASGDPLVVVTAHRRENWAGGLGRIAEGIGRLAGAHPEVRFVIPLHPNPLVRTELGAPLADYANVVRTEPLAYAPFARLMSRAALIVTDSGGIQEEAPALGVPVLVARESTERGEGVKAGMLRLVGTNPDRIVAEAGAVLADPAAHRVDPERNPYGDGRAATRIVTALEYVAGLKEVPDQFGPGFSRRAVLEAAGYPTSLLDRPLDERDVQPDRSEEHDRWVGR